VSSHEADAERAPADVLQIVNEAIVRLQSHPDAAVRDAVQSLLEGIDAVHRTGLTRLVGAVQAMAGDAFINRLTTDPAVRLLLMSYNLIAVDRRLQAEEALDAVRGHLHDHGVDIEILDVVGGVVTVRLHWRGPADAPSDAATQAVRQDIEAALLEHFLGFQELVIGGGAAASAPVRVTTLDALRRGARPVYHDAGDRDALPEGGMMAVEVAGVPILLVCLAGDVYALRNRCGDSPLPLQFGSLSGAELQCSWHGCRYDVRTGRRMDGAGEGVQVFPASIGQGRIHIALGVTAAGDAS
jgi:nitrite reductase/ring-hydroxylating ferredoxin subunit